MFSKQARVNRSITGGLAVALSAGLIAAPAAYANSHKVRLKASAPVNSATGKINGSASGKPFGTCKLTGRLQPPKAILKLSCKGGTLRMTASSSTGASNDVKGSWKIRGGTGKYKGARGKGSYSGKISTTRFTYVGSVSY